MPDRARADWSENMSRLAIDCAGSSQVDTRKRLREMWDLISVATLPSLIRGVNAIAPARMQALLSAEAFESAAIEMIGSELTYRISLGPTGHVASIKLSGSELEALCAAETFALAVIGALASALAQRSKEPLVRLVSRS